MAKKKVHKEVMILSQGGRDLLHLERDLLINQNLKLDIRQVPSLAELASLAEDETAGASGPPISSGRVLMLDTGFQ